MTDFGHTIGDARKRDQSEPQVQVRTWRVESIAALGLHEINRSLFTILVEDGGSKYGWAIRWQGRCLNADGGWEYEPQPSSRSKKWLKAHRFPEDQALERAKKAVDSLTVVGMTASQMLERESAS